MCYYADWDERFLKATKEIRKSKSQAEQLMSRAKEAGAPPRPGASAEPVKRPVTELDEFTF